MLLNQWRVLKATHPDLHLLRMTHRALSRHPSPLPPETMAAIVIFGVYEPVEPVLDRLSAPGEWRRALHDAQRLLRDAPRDLGDPDALEAFADTGEAGRLAARLLDPDTQRPFQVALRRWERTRPHLDAAALQRLGVRAGPEFGAWLRELRRARFLGTLGSAAEARREVRRRLAGHEDRT